VALSAKPGRRVKPAVIAAGTAAVVLATGAAAIAAAVYQPVTNKTDARCFTAADTSGFGTVIADAGKPGTKGAVQNAWQVCAAQYRLVSHAGCSADQPQTRPGSAPRAFAGGVYLAGRHRGGLSRLERDMRETRPPSGSTALVQL
jgi:hypothetical protein